MALRRGSGQHNFSRAPQAFIPRSRFVSDYQYKTTFNSGLLIPFFMDEIYPGDTLGLTPTFFARLLTPVVPFMDNLYFDWFFFYVPLRLLWENFEKQQGAQDNPGDSTDYLEPQVTGIPSAGLPLLSIYDYFGLPTQVPFPANDSNFTFSALPLRAYNLIWNEWFRDENLQDSVPFNRGDGPDNYSDYVLKRRGKRHDYFTSALPWPEKGPGVEIPLGTTAPVVGDGNSLGLSVYDSKYSPAGVKDGGFSLVYSSGEAGFDTNMGIVPANLGQPVNSTYRDGPLHGTSGVARYYPVGVSTVSSNSGLVADLSSATAATINTLRLAFQTQKLYERDARGGTRYTEILRSHFGVISPDARLQRPEYLGGGSTMINVNPVAQTSSTDATTPQGNMAAYGTLSSTGKGGFRKSFVEHGLVIGLFSVRADLTYQQGLSRQWQRHTRFDRYYPVFAHIGEQMIKNSEIYFANDFAQNNAPFGYQEAWAELRYKPSIITGKFRSTAKNSTGASDSLDVWHLAQNFTNLPVLNSEFIEENPPVARVIAVQNEPEFQLDSVCHMNFVRPLPMYSVPGFVDHF